MKTLGTVLTGLLVLCCNASASDDPEALQSSELSPVRSASVKMAVVPVYPPRALKKKIDGEVTVAFTISRYGRAIDASIESARPTRLK